jgi:hypothetical protein
MNSNCFHLSEIQRVMQSNPNIDAKILSEPPEQTNYYILSDDNGTSIKRTVMEITADMRKSTNNIDKNCIIQLSDRQRDAFMNIN